MTRAVAVRARPVARAVRALRDPDGRRSLTLIGWHRVDGTTSHGLSTSVPDFARHLEVLQSWGARVMPLDEAWARLSTGKQLPPRAVVLTFDDGYASVVHTAWPLLKERGWPASLFVVTDSLTRDVRFPWDHRLTGELPGRLQLASADELGKAAADGLDLGSHTCTHPLLTALDGPTLRLELQRSRDDLGELLGRAVTSIAYPTGAWNRRVRAAAGDAGYRIAITVDRGMATPRSSPLSLPRAFVPHQPADLELLLDGAYTFLKPFDYLRDRRSGIR